MPRRPLLAGLIAVASASLLSPVLPGQGPPGYYASVNAATAATLRATLHAVIDDHTRVPYTASAPTIDTWNVLEQAQQDPANANNIVDLYRNASYVKIGGGVGAYNREHSWPKSYGFPDDHPTNYPYTDCHLLFLSDANYNTARSNRAYQTSSQFGTEQLTLLTNGAGGGSGVYPGNSNWYDAVTATGRWQTWGDRRGDVARAVMYADVRYEGGQHSSGAIEPNLILTDNVTLIDQSNTGSNEVTGYMGMLATLLLWHTQDPVDQRERNRNDVVYSYQGNRNPFIDHPEWIACLFSSQCGDTTPPAAPAGLVASAAKSKANLDWANNTEPDLAGYRVYRSTVPGGPYALLTTSLLTASAYTNTGLRTGAAYFFVVRAVDVSGNESASSNQATAWLPWVPITPTVATNVHPVWINEIHYDNTGTDQGEFIEVAGVAGTNLSGYTMHLYNGATGTVYNVLNLGGTLGNQQNGFGTWPFVVGVNGLQNDDEGVALVAPGGQVLQFLSWEGSVAATAGPAAGMTSTMIPTAESGTTPVGFSLQLQGTGHGGAAFAWSLPLAATMGFPNTGQTIQ